MRAFPLRCSAGFQLSVVSGNMPGLSAMTGGAGMARQQAQATAQQAEAARNVQSIAEMGNVMMPILPNLMRGERVITLAQTRNCEWVQGMMGQSNAAAYRRRLDLPWRRRLSLAA